MDFDKIASRIASVASASKATIQAEIKRYGDPEGEEGEGDVLTISVNGKNLTAMYVVEPIGAGWDIQQDETGLPSEVRDELLDTISHILG